MKIVIELSKDDMQTLMWKLSEKAMEIEDDGNEGDPDAAVLWNVHKQIKQEMK